MEKTLSNMGLIVRARQITFAGAHDVEPLSKYIYSRME